MAVNNNAVTNFQKQLTAAALAAESGAAVIGELDNITFPTEEGSYTLKGFDKASQQTLTATANKADSTADTVTQHEQKIATATEQLGALQQTVSEHGNSINSNTQGLTTLQSTVSAHGQSIEANTQDVTELKSSTETLTQQVEALQKERPGHTVFAYKNFTLEENKEEMTPGVFYQVPFNAKDQFIKYDSTTQEPAADQEEGVDDTVVDYYKVASKTSEGVLKVLQKKFDLTDSAYTDKDNTFIKNNTFSVAPQVTAEQSLATAGDNEVATVKAVKGAGFTTPKLVDEVPPDAAVGTMYLVKAKQQA